MLRERPLWLLSALVVIFFHAPLTTGTLYFRDLYQLFYPKRLLLSDRLAAWELPLWDAMTNGGQPFLATPSNTAFYPSHLLLLVLEPVTALNVSIVLQYLLCAVAAYWLARVVRLSQWGAFVSGAVFTFAGCSLSTANLLPLLLALPWVPLTIGCTLLYLRTGAHRWLTLAAICATMPLLAAAVELTAMMFVTLALWIVPARHASAPLPSRVRTILFAGIFAVLLAMMQILPATEVIANSSRGSARSYESFSKWSVDPRRLPELVVPSFFGDVRRLDERDYWGRARESDGFPYFLSIYFGAATLVLAAAGASNARSDAELPRRTLAALAISGVVLSLGSSLPFFHALWERLPLVATFRYPVKAMLIAILPIALLAGAGIDAIATASRRTSRLTVLVAFSVATLSMIFAMLLRSATSPVAVQLRSYFGNALGDPQRANLQWSFLHVMGALAVMALVIARCRPPLRAPLIAVVVAADLCIAGFAVNGYAPRSFFDPPAAAQLVRNITIPGRFHRAPDPAALRLTTPTNDLMWLSRWKIEALSGYSATAWGIPVVFHVDYDGLAPERIRRLSEILAKVPWPQRIRALQAAGVRSFMTTDVVRAAEVEEVAVLRTAEASPIHLYRIPSTRTARFVSRAIIVRSDEEALRAMFGGLPYDTIALEGSAAAAHDCGTGTVELERGSAEVMIMRANAPCSGWIVLSENDYPGWITKVNGVEVPTQRADFAFVAIPVSRGRHIIERRYEPRLPLLGVSISAIAFAGLAGLHLARRNRRDEAQ